MERKVILIILLLLSLCYAKYPQPYTGNTINFNNEKKMTELIHIIRAYPKTLKVIKHQQKVINKLEDNQKIYDDIRKDLERRQRKNKIIIITLGVTIPIVAGLVGYGVWRIDR